MEKNLCTKKDTRPRSLGHEDPQEKGIATHSNFLALRIPWTEKLCRLQSMGLQRLRHDWATNPSLHFMGFEGLPWWLSSKESACQCRRHGFDPWVGKNPLEERMAAHSSILAWRTLWTEEPGELQSMELQRVGRDLSDTHTHTHTHTHSIETNIWV